MSLKLASCVVWCWMSVFLSFGLISFPIFQSRLKVSECGTVLFYDLIEESQFTFLIIKSFKSLWAVMPAVIFPTMLAKKCLRRSELAMFLQLFPREARERCLGVTNFKHQTLSLTDWLAGSVSDFSLELTPRCVNRPDWQPERQLETNLSRDLLKLKSS